MEKKHLTKKITAIGAIGMLVATPFALADTHNSTEITGDIEATQDLEEEMNNLSVNLRVEDSISVNGVELTTEISLLIDALKTSLSNYEEEVEIEIEAEEGEVTTNVEGNLNEEQQEIVSSIETQVQQLIGNNTQAEIEIEIESETEIEENETSRNESQEFNEELREERQEFREERREENQEFREEMREQREEMREERILSNSVGVEMRFAQLKARLDARIQNANLVVDTLAQTNVSSEDLTTLQNISEDFTQIRDELNNTDAPKEANEFVAYKQSIIDLSQEFKTIASPYITDDMRGELESQIRANRENSVEQNQESIEDLRKRLNSKIITNNFGNITGVDVENLSEQYINGEISLGQLQQELRAQYRNLDAEQRATIKAKVSEKRNRASIEAQANAEQRSERAENIKNQIRERIGPNNDQGVENRDSGNQIGSISDEERQEMIEELSNLSQDQIQQLQENPEQIEEIIGENLSEKIESNFNEIRRNLSLREIESIQTQPSGGNE